MQPPAALCFSVSDLYANLLASKVDRETFSCFFAGEVVDLVCGNARRLNELNFKQELSIWGGLQGEFQLRSVPWKKNTARPRPPWNASPVPQAPGLRRTPNFSHDSGSTCPF